MYVSGKKNVELLEKNLKEACKDETFKNLVQKLKLTKEEALTNVTKLEDTIEELNHCKNCKGLYECKNYYVGHVCMPRKEEGFFTFSYAPCRYKKKELDIRKSELEKNKEARMKDIDATDKKRAKVIKWIIEYFENFDLSKSQKGLYLSGSFGSGKTFLVAALLNELEEKKNVTTELIYFPEVLKDLKDWELYDVKMKFYQTVDVLCIDDIGAEKVSEWSRDEVLGTILQARMNAHLPTFFTSNLTLEELEIHLGGKESDKLKARRIIERIKQLTEELSLVSENRRR